MVTYVAIMEIVSSTQAFFRFDSALKTGSDHIHIRYIYIFITEVAAKLKYVQKTLEQTWHA